MKTFYTLLILLIPIVGFGQLTYIPDDNFEQALIDLDYDDVLDDYVLTENIDEVTSLNIAYKNITDLTGIESFSSLIYLEASVNNLSEINLSQNIWLEQLSLGFNNLQNIDLSNNLLLRYLYINNNILSNLFFVSSNALEVLQCQNNFLTSLELSSNINLKYLNCSHNFLSFLNLSTSETGIIELDCNDNQLSYLFDNQPFFDGFPNLTSLNCFNNQLDSLNLNNSPSLTNLNCSNNNLLSLNISGSTSLLDINFNDNQLTTLDVSNNNYLENFEGENNQLISLDFNNHPLLQGLNCNSNLLTSLNINSCLALTFLTCNNNELTEIDIQYNPSISITNANNNQITNFLTNNNYNLQILDLHNNQLSSIDLNNLYNIKFLTIQNNNYNYLELNSLFNLENISLGSPNLTSLDLGDNYYLKNLRIYAGYDYLNDSSYYTPLTSINLKNNNNEIMEMLNFSGAGENLLCIEVDDVDFCYQNNVWNNAINNINGFLINTDEWPTTIYSEDCNSAFGCTDSLACNYNSSASLNDGSCYNTLDVNLEYYNVSCNGGNDGIANVSVNNGSFPYIINWSVSDFNENSISGLMADSYSFTVTDNDGCSTNEILFDINEPQIISSVDIMYSCDSIIYNGIYYQSVQNFVDTLISSNGCDSLSYISIVPNYVSESYNSISAYLFYYFNGDTINESGEYSTTLVNSYGCDSIINITIEIIEASWNCINDACVDSMDGSGDYSTLNDCEQECQDVSSISETLIDINIYPNPSYNIFNLEFYSDFKTEISLINVLGEQVYLVSNNSIGEFKTQIDLSNYSKGIYNLTIKTSDGISNHKLILQ